MQRTGEGHNVCVPAHLLTPIWILFQLKHLLPRSSSSIVLHLQFRTSNVSFSSEAKCIFHFVNTPGNNQQAKAHRHG